MDGTADESRASTTREAILVVDDEADIREVLTEILEREGYAVDTATDGLDGLSRIARRKYYAVVSDVSMPGMNGTELYRRLAQNNAELASRFILLTGDPLGGSIQAFLDETGVPCIAKPFTPADIRRVIASRYGTPPRAA